MADRHTVRIFCWSRATSPITHADRSEGNFSVLAREPVLVASSGMVRQVPFLSGNALRHACVREPGSSWLVDALELAGRLSLPETNFLFHGGGITESTSAERLGRLAALRDVFPLFSVLGGCLPDQIITGELKVSRGVLVCRENAARLRAMLPDGFALEVELRPAEDFVRKWQYVKFDSAAQPAQLRALSTEGTLNAEMAIGGSAPVDRGQTKGKTGTMPFAGDGIIPGAIFAHDFLVRDVSEIEIGALAHALREWQRRGGLVGSQSSRGHGRVDTSFVAVGAPKPLETLANQYVVHMAGARDRAVQWLRDGFAERARKAKKTAS